MQSALNSGLKKIKEFEAVKTDNDKVMRIQETQEDHEYKDIIMVSLQYSVRPKLNSEKNIQNSI